MLILLLLHKKELELKIKNLTKEHNLTLKHKTEAHADLRKIHTKAELKLENLENELNEIKAKQIKEETEVDKLEERILENKEETTDELLKMNKKKGNSCMKFELHLIEIVVLFIFAIYIGIYYGYDMLDMLFSYKPNFRVT